MGSRGRRFEVSTKGFDENLQLIGSDSLSSPYWVGLRVPANATTDPKERYTALLAFARFGAGSRARLVGIRQLLTIGCFVPNDNQDAPASFPLERPVETPFWKFVDGNVLWALRIIPPILQPTASTQNKEGRQFRYGTTPAFLFETTVGDSPIPPYAGGLPGNALVPDLYNFYDIRFPWVSDKAWDALDVSIQGPCDVVLFASIRQTSLFRLALPGTPPFLTTTGITPEDAFVGNNDTAQYWRVAGSLMFEEEDGTPTKPETEKFPKRPSLPDSARDSNYDNRH